jgi:hypothetical protein
MKLWTYYIYIIKILKHNKDYKILHNFVHIYIYYFIILFFYLFFILFKNTRRTL